MVIVKFLLLLLWGLADGEWMVSALVGTRKSSTGARVMSKPNTQLNAISTSRSVVLDGAEWASVEPLLPSSPSLSDRPHKAGYMTVVTGTTPNDSSTRVLGIQVSQPREDEKVISLDDGVQIYKESMVTIPRNIKDQDAVSTLIASLSGVYCGLPRLERVGGGSGESFVSGKAVVMGGSDYARFVSEALATLGASVSWITTRKGITSKHESIEVMPPAVGEMQLGFAAVLGEFDSLVDTMSDELNRAGFAGDEYDGGIFQTGGSGVVSLLKKRHKCQRYVSTLTESQRIVRDEGVLFGPKKADQHATEITKVLTSNKFPSNEYRYISPPKGFAKMLQTLLDKGVVFSGNNKAVRGWSLQDFWELASWPRDSEGGANVRFGLPVIDDIDSLRDEEEEEMVSAPPMTNVVVEGEEEAEEEKEAPVGKNPFVMDISDVSGLQKQVLSSDRDCVLFMSAPYCRTCRYLTPAFTRMARIVSSDKDNIFFAKANTAGKSGKELGRALQVESVPTFVMFRGGRRYGSPLAVSRLPSKKLDLAVQYLTSGKEWDSTAFRDIE